MAPEVIWVQRDHGSHGPAHKRPLRVSARVGRCGPLNLTIATGEALEAEIFRGEGHETTSVTVGLGERVTHFPPTTEPGGANLLSLFEDGRRAIQMCDSPFERATAYFLFADASQFYFDGNKRTAPRATSSRAEPESLPDKRQRE